MIRIYMRSLSIQCTNIDDNSHLLHTLFYPLPRHHFQFTIPLKNQKLCKLPSSCVIEVMEFSNQRILIGSTESSKKLIKIMLPMLLWSLLSIIIVYWKWNFFKSYHSLEKMFNFCLPPPPTKSMMWHNVVIQPLRNTYVLESKYMHTY